MLRRFRNIFVDKPVNTSLSEKGSLFRHQERRLSLRIIYAFLLCGNSSPVHAQEPEWLSVTEDYITCRKQPCVRIAGSRWSEMRPNSVAISVRMGTQPAVSDLDIKRVLTRDFAKYGVTNLKFFYEQNDAPACGIAFHVRGGTEGIFLISDVRSQVEAIARRALNSDEALR